MSLFEYIKNKTNEYIKITDALELVAKKECSLFKAATIFSYYKLGNELTCYHVGDDYSISSENSFNQPFDEGSLYIYEALKGEEQLQWLYPDNFIIDQEKKEKYCQFYWKKADFFNFKPIKELSLSEGVKWLKQDKIEKDKALNKQLTEIENRFKENPSLREASRIELQWIKASHDSEVGKFTPFPLDWLEGMYDFDIYTNKPIKLQAKNEALKKRIVQLESENRVLIENKESIEKDPVLNTKSFNSVVKFICVLVHMAKIDTDSPFASYESLKVQADLLGIEKFPNKDTVAKWLKAVEDIKEINSN